MCNSLTLTYFQLSLSFQGPTIGSEVAQRCLFSVAVPRNSQDKYDRTLQALLSAAQSSVRNVWMSELSGQLEYLDIKTCWYQKHADTRGLLMPEECLCQ